MKQTAVEWLVKEFNLESHKATVALVKEMERQQIIKAFNEGMEEFANDTSIEVYQGEQYYDKTFEK